MSMEDRYNMLEDMLSAHSWEKTESISGAVVYKKDYIVLRLDKYTDMIGVEYYKGDRSLDTWLNAPSASFWAMAATLEFKEGSPHQVFFQGGTLKL